MTKLQISIQQLCDEFKLMKVLNDKVGKVINEVLKLSGNVPNAVPSSSTVSRMIDAKLAAAHKHISSLLQEKPNTTLYIDETKHM